MTSTAFALMDRIETLEQQVRRLTTRLEALETKSVIVNDLRTVPVLPEQKVPAVPEQKEVFIRKPRGNALYVHFDQGLVTHGRVPKLVEAGLFRQLEDAGFRIVKDLSNADYAAFVRIATGRWTLNIDSPVQKDLMKSFNRPAFWIFATWGDSFTHGSLDDWRAYSQWRPFYFDYMKRKVFEGGTPTPESINLTAFN
jgi:hypothetical protein